MLINQVDIKAVEKDLRKVPIEILKKFRKWVDDIETYGLEETRKVPGWRDHVLYGDRVGQRSICLNRKWRAIYIMIGDYIKIVKVIEVHAHDY